MSKEQFQCMGLIVADLQHTVDVLEGLFIGKSKEDSIETHFPEIGKVIYESLVVRLIAGSAALFSDSASFDDKDENMSLENLHEKYGGDKNERTNLLFKKIKIIVRDMNIKKYRHKYVAHFDLKELTRSSNNKIKRNITIENLREICLLSQEYIQLLAWESGIFKKTEYMSYYKENIIGEMIDFSKKLFPAT